jgi:hypothetical protein
VHANKIKNTIKRTMSVTTTCVASNHLTDPDGAPFMAIDVAEILPHFLALNVSILTGSNHGV